MSRPNLLAWVLWIVVGTGLGLYIGWVVAPVQYVETTPNTLQQVYKDDYVLMLATAYAADGDLAAARAGLTVLGLAETPAAVRATADRLAEANYPTEDLDRLSSLAEALEGAASAASPE